MWGEKLLLLYKQYLCQGGLERPVPLSLTLSRRAGFRTELGGLFFNLRVYEHRDPLVLIQTAF